MSVTHDFDTSILRVSFADPDPAVALAGVKALADSVIGANPVSPRIAPRSLSLVHVPTAAVSQSMSWPKVAVLGIFFGLVLGLVLALALERTHRRIDDLEMLSAEMGCAVSSLAGASEATIVALLDRWHHIAEATPARIALLPVSPASAEAASGIAERLAPERVKNRRAAGSEKSRVTRDRNVVVEVGGMPGGASAGEQLALSADLVVLVAVEGVLAADVRKTLSVLETFGVSPSWALFAPSSEGRSRERATAHVEPDSDPVAPGGRVSSDRREPTKSRPEEPTPVVKAAPAEGPRPRARQRPARTLGTRGHDADIPARATDQG